MNENKVQKIDYDTMMSYEKQSGFIGLGKFLENLGVAVIVGGESCSKK